MAGAKRRRASVGYGPALTIHCEEPTGPRERAPDDRLRDEAIHPLLLVYGLLRGACHRVALRAAPLA